MEVVKTIAAMRQARQRMSGRVGFVPTMGYLHEGHISLVRQARAENDTVVVSIFVNPTQFGPSEDLSTYPRDMSRDTNLLAREGVETVFVPSAEEMYPFGFQTWVEVSELSRPLEGAGRPGHFRGVATVVAKLFNIVQPHRAYFGQKDAQQVRVIQQMVSDLDMDIQIVVCATVRERDGLAMSSRNSYLNEQERKAAAVLYRALGAALSAWERGERNAQHLRSAIAETLAKEPLVQPEYISISNPATLQELEQVSDCALLSLAARAGKARLIDNLLLPPRDGNL
ncbi:MAG: pantoate--beta-alanine ligase [Chloroflexi bacterium]|nr:pantoate--beta-alanine ligase [Chloroflexota bacterium]